jgi:hypothetical protein
MNNFSITTSAKVLSSQNSNRMLFGPSKIRHYTKSNSTKENIPIKFSPPPNKPAFLKKISPPSGKPSKNFFNAQTAAFVSSKPTFKPPPTLHPNIARNRFKNALNSKNNKTLRETYKKANNSTRTALKRYVTPYSREDDILKALNENIAYRTANIPVIEEWNESISPTLNDILHVQNQLRFINRMMTELKWIPDEEKMKKLEDAKRRAEKLLEYLQSYSSKNVSANFANIEEKRRAQLNLNTDDEEIINLLKDARSKLPENKLKEYTNHLKSYLKQKNILFDAYSVYEDYDNKIKLYRGCVQLNSPCSEYQIDLYEDAVKQKPSAKSEVIKRYSDYKTSFETLKKYKEIPLPTKIEDPFSIRTALSSAGRTIRSLASSAASGIKQTPQFARNAYTAAKSVTPKQAAKAIGKGAYEVGKFAVETAGNIATSIVEEELMSARRGIRGKRFTRKDRRN